MITFNYETDFEISNEEKLSAWIENIIIAENFELGEINYIFCDDEYLLKLNIEFLQHDTLTDIISFDNTMGKEITGDIFISVDRVKENATEFKVSLKEEINRVMIHGVLHYMGIKDKSKEQKELMRNKENDALSLLNN
jgi:probable rRNA maturation factor